MKKLLIMLMMVFVSIFALTGCDKKPELTDVAKAEAKACFDFFWNEQQTIGGASGLIPDRYPDNGLSSIASVGFGLTAFPIGVENGWITHEEGYNRSLLTLYGMKNLETINGFFYHFYDSFNGTPKDRVEVSCIDTAILMCGALFAGEYFGGEVAEVANQLYAAVDWPTYVNPNTNQFYMAHKPWLAADKQYEGAWDWYGEQLMMYFLAAGSPTHPVGKEVYDSFQRPVQTYGDYEVISSWFGSIFTYQFSHAWIDFRNLKDADGINWYDNSVQATLAHQQYCVDLSSQYQTFGELSWGLTACDGPNGYSGLYGAAPNGGVTTDDAVTNDGTVALCGAIGSLPFAPQLVLDTMDHYYEILDGELFGEYGFYDSYNLENGTWIGYDYIGIDKGISLLMIENYRSELVWKTFMECDFMDTAIEVLGFKKTK